MMGATRPLRNNGSAAGTAPAKDAARSGPVLTDKAEIRHDWTEPEALSLFELSLNDLLVRAHGLYRRYFDANEVQLSTLLNVKTGGCPEDCRYCAQSARYRTGVGAA